MNITSRILASTIFSLACSSVFAHGDVACDVPKEERRPSVDLQRKLKSEGWTVRKIQLENGCYEVYGYDEKDARVEAFFNPKTFDRVK